MVCEGVGALHLARTVGVINLARTLTRPIL
jgi:hypothetical protein